MGRAVCPGIPTLEQRLEGRAGGGAWNGVVPGCPWGRWGLWEALTQQAARPCSKASRLMPRDHAQALGMIPAHVQNDIHAMAGRLSGLSRKVCDSVP